MKIKILFCLLLVLFYVANTGYAQQIKITYPKPNGVDQIPFGKKLPVPALNDQQKLKQSFDPGLANPNGYGGQAKNQQQSASSSQSLVQRPISQQNMNGNFHLTKDINARSESDPQNYTQYNYPSEFAVLNNVSYFMADDGIHGFELWRSNATAAGTYLIKDINPGEASSGNNGNITVADGKLYLPAKTADYGDEPWVSDGTEPGTHQLLDISFGTDGSYPNQFVGVNKSVFFIANGTQLWKTDGTTAGTIIVKDLSISDNIAQVSQSTSAHGLLFFTAYSYNSGWQLWRSDGTDAGTYIPKQIGYFQYDYIAPLQLTEYNSKLYFSVDDGTGRRLWTSDGTNAGTNYATGNNDVFMQPDYLNVGTRNPFPVINNILYFAGYIYTGGGGLYKYDASNTNGEILVKDLTTSPEVDFITPVDFAIVNNRLYFKVINSSRGYHDELWESDGDDTNTKRIVIYPPGQVTFDYNNGNGLLFFNKVDAVYGNELWKSDGTPQGTKLVKDIWPGKTSSRPYYLTECNGKLLFNGADNIKGGSLYVSDGTTAGTYLLKDINTNTTSSSNAGGYSHGDMCALNNGVVFNATERAHGYEVYKSDGSNDGTLLLKDILEGEADSYPNAFLNKNGIAYFRANNTDGSSAIYKTDGTTVSTKKIVDVNNAYLLGYNVTDNGLVYYTIFNFSTFTYDLWRSDGTLPGTYLLSPALYFNPYIVTAGNTVYFVAGDYEHGYELWKSDGSVAGTKLVKDIYKGYLGSYPFSLFVYKNEVYFGAYDGDGYSTEFWKSNGTPNGTIKLKQITPAFGYDNYSISQLFCVSNNKLFFNAIDYNANPYQGGELWQTDGAPSSTKLVKDINPFYDSNPYNLTDVNGTLFFTADDGINGKELWKSNGKAEGTIMVKDISAGGDFSYFDNFCTAGGKLYFLRDHYTSNPAIWSSDGTDANTNPVGDPGLVGLTSIQNLTVSSNKLFFGAYTYKYGQELYAGDLTNNTFASVNSTKISSLISELNAEKFDAIIYPNPANSFSSLQIKGSVKDVSITITDITGKVIWKKFNDNHSQINLPIEKFAAGVYILKVKSGIDSKTIKLVKQ